MVTNEHYPCCISNDFMNVKICEFVMNKSTCKGAYFCLLNCNDLVIKRGQLKDIIMGDMGNILHDWGSWVLVGQVLFNLGTRWN